MLVALSCTAAAAFVAPSAAPRLARAPHVPQTMVRCDAAFEGSTWKITLNVGREEGMTTMADSWASSGARLMLPLQVTFLDDLADCDLDDALDKPVKRLTCSDGGFISNTGEVKVTGLTGAWSAAPVVDSDGNDYGQRVLRFFLEFPKQLQRNDVSIPAGRLYFSTPCWDGSGAERRKAYERMDEVQQQLDELSEELKAMMEERKSSGEVGFLRAAGRVKEDLQRAQQAQQLIAKLQQYQSVLPDPDACIEGDDGVWIAREGGLAIIRRTDKRNVFGGSAGSSFLSRKQRSCAHRTAAHMPSADQCAASPTPFDLSYLFPLSSGALFRCQTDSEGRHKRWRSYPRPRADRVSNQNVGVRSLGSYRC